MKATLEFDLPEEATEHMAAVQGMEWKLLVFNFDQQLRSHIKYGGAPKTIENIRDELREAIADAGLSLDD